MLPETPLEIQWFAYALADNEAMTDADAVELWENLNRTQDLAEFAEAVIDILTAEMSLEEQNELVEQIQELVDYACEQAAAGFAPADTFAEGENGDSDLEITDNCYAYLPDISDAENFSDAEAIEVMSELLTSLRKLGCSDLHISAGAPPFVRRLRNIERIAEQDVSDAAAEKLNLALLSAEQREAFKKNQDLGFALEIGKDRFRVCLMEQKGGISGSYRLVPAKVCPLEELGFLPKDVIYIKRLLDYHNGLVLVTGPIGAGKSTTLAAMIDIINEKRSDHIISVEDPIEVMHLSRNCQVSQREIGKHTASYRTALKAALREDPDIIVIGEMHDLETIENAITASETGHLVIGTLHTGNAANTLNRLLDVFPPSQQPQIRAMTAGSMRGVICQKLIPDGYGGLTLIYELMLNSMAVANIISEGKTFQLESTMITANKNGMCTFDQCLLEKYTLELITREAALAEMHDQTIITQLNSIWARREAQANKKK